MLGAKRDPGRASPRVRSIPRRCWASIGAQFVVFPAFQRGAVHAIAADRSICSSSRESIGRLAGRIGREPLGRNREYLRECSSVPPLLAVNGFLDATGAGPIERAGAVTAQMPSCRLFGAFKFEAALAVALPLTPNQQQKQATEPVHDVSSHGKRFCLPYLIETIHPLIKKAT